MHLPNTSLVINMFGEGFLSFWGGKEGVTGSVKGAEFLERLHPADQRLARIWRDAHAAAPDFHARALRKFGEGFGRVFVVANLSFGDVKFPKRWGLGPKPQLTLLSRFVDKLNDAGIPATWSRFGGDWYTLEVQVVSGEEAADVAERIRGFMGL